MKTPALSIGLNPINPNLAQCAAWIHVYGGKKLRSSSWSDGYVIPQQVRGVCNDSGLIRFNGLTASGHHENWPVGMAYEYDDTWEIVE